MDAQSEAALAVLAHRVESMHDGLRELTAAVTKLAIVEERQAQAALAQERAFKVIEKLEVRVANAEVRIGELEKSEPEQQRASKWVFAAVWGACGLVGVVVVELATMLLRRLTGG